MMNLDRLLMLRVVPPLGAVLEEPAASVAMSTALGEIEVPYGHVSLVVLLEPGEMRVRDGFDRERVFATGEGFARIDGKSVTIFSDVAEDAAGIAQDQAEEAKRGAETALALAAKLLDDEQEVVDLVLRESVVKIEISLRRKDGSQRRRPAPDQ